VRQYRRRVFQLIYPQFLVSVARKRISRVSLRQRAEDEGVTWKMYEISIPLENRTNCIRNRSSRRSHVSRDVQERIVVVLDRSLLVGLVVHFKNREFRTRADRSPVSSSDPLLTVSFPAFYRLSCRGDNTGR